MLFANTVLGSTANKELLFPLYAKGDWGLSPQQEKIGLQARSPKGIFRPKDFLGLPCGLKLKNHSRKNTKIKPIIKI